MRLYLRFTAFRTYTDSADIDRLRATVGGKVQELQQAGKLETGGIFAGNLAGLVVLDVAARLLRDARQALDGASSELTALPGRTTSARTPCRVRLNQAMKPA
jgi:hypothetical protein